MPENPGFLYEIGTVLELKVEATIESDNDVSTTLSRGTLWEIIGYQISENGCYYGLIPRQNSRIVGIVQDLVGISSKLVHSEEYFGVFNEFLHQREQVWRKVFGRIGSPSPNFILPDNMETRH